MKPFRKWFQLGRVRAFGAPIHVHWSVAVVVVVLMLVSLESLVLATVAIASYLAVITLHELGHAFAVNRLGYRVDSIWIHVIHGRCEFMAPEYEWEHVKIAWAGVLTQLAIAVPVLVSAYLIPAGNRGYFGPAIIFLGYINLIIALFNLAPAAGFDGKVAWRLIPLLQAARRTKQTPRNVTSLRRRRR